MKIIVTGANGQLGSEIKHLSQNFSWDFVFTDIDSLDLLNNTDLEEFIKSEQPQYIINCAAYTAVDKAETETEMAMKVNAEVPKQIAILSKKYNFKLIHISTDYVYSGENHRPITETETANPASAYGKTKMQGDTHVLENSDAIILRISWLYSAYGNNFVKSMLRLGNEKEQLGVVFDQIGSPTNAADLANDILKIITFTENNTWESGVYHYSNEGVTSWYDFAKEIMELGERNCVVKPIETSEYPLPAPRPAYSVLNKKKIKTTFKLEIPHWKDSLKEVVYKLK
ncbi:MAG: dTDP-4-dehydrorhamnose reductase [Bacteroidales bacterium]|nr:dTDP-4-dehydrorhamnose reductase [Bacteroidales bacterium]MBN2819903.1 dTDP-4-dehydrorhamnose reductase [Bacteroidales bacterium]